MSKPKKPQDRQRKAVDRLREEAREGARSTIAREVTLSGRRGDVTVAVLDDPMEWGIEATELIELWHRRDPRSGGITASEMLRFLMAIVSVEDADRLRAVEPTQASLTEAAGVIIAGTPPGDAEDESDDESLGESQAS